MTLNTGSRLRTVHPTNARASIGISEPAVGEVRNEAHHTAGSITNDDTVRYVEQPAPAGPPLTEEQRAQLAALLAPAVDNLRRRHESLAYPVPMAARLIGIGPQHAWDLVRNGEIPSFVEDGRRLVSRRALEEYVAAREADPT